MDVIGVDGETLATSSTKPIRKPRRHLSENQKLNLIITLFCVAMFAGLLVAAQTELLP
jgi:hypothetical protein